MTVTCAAWARIPHPLCLTAAQWQVSASMPRGTLPSSRRWRWLPHPSAPPTSLLTENWYLLTNCCQHVSETERVRAVWTGKKKEKTRDVWESQREESKQVRINDTQTGFFPLFGGRRKERSEPHRREYSSLWKSNDECQKKKSSRKVKVGSSWKMYIMCVR